MKKRSTAGTGRQKGTAMATRKNNEAALTEALYEAITATDDQAQQEAARRAHSLAEVVSSRALARAKKAALEKRNNLLASIKPPRKRKPRMPDEQPKLTEAVAMSAMQAYGQVCDKHDVDDGCRDVMWQCIATFCMWQLKQKKGPFYEQARAEGVLDQVFS